MSLFSKIDGTLRLVIVTAAFSMGVNCPDVHHHPLGSSMLTRAICSRNWSCWQRWSLVISQGNLNRHTEASMIKHNKMPTSGTFQNIHHACMKMMIPSLL